MTKRDCMQSGRACVAVAAILATLLTTPAWAGKKTCLTGTDPEVAADAAQIAIVRQGIETNCACVSFDGTPFTTHTRYVSCAKGVVSFHLLFQLLRRECSNTVTQYYATSSCGRSPSKPAVPCIKKKGNKVSCSIKPASKCSGVACPSFTTCEDAADTNGDGLIGVGDSGACLTDNLLANPSFEEADILHILGITVSLRRPWEYGAYLRSGTFAEQTSEVAHDGALSVKLDSPTTSNDARWTQTVSVQPNTVYRFSGWVKTQDVAHTAEIVGAGANRCLFGDFVRAPGVLGTNDWTLRTLTFNSGNANQVAVCVRLGFFSGTTTGTAWFDDLRLVAGGARGAADLHLHADSDANANEPTAAGADVHANDHADADADQHAAAGRADLHAHADRAHAHVDPQRDADEHPTADGDTNHHTHGDRNQHANSRPGRLLRAHRRRDLHRLVRRCGSGLLCSEQRHLDAAAALQLR